MRDGIECPACGSRWSECTNVYRLQFYSGGRLRTKLRRRRACLHCGRSFYSVEDLDAETETGVDQGPGRVAGTAESTPVAGSGEREPKITLPQNPYL